MDFNKGIPVLLSILVGFFVGVHAADEKRMMEFGVNSDSNLEEELYHPSKLFTDDDSSNKEMPLDEKYVDIFGLNSGDSSADATSETQQDETASTYYSKGSTLPSYVDVFGLKKMGMSPSTDTKEMNDTTVFENSTSTNVSSSNLNNKQVLCESLNKDEDMISDVEIINATVLQKILYNHPGITSRTTEAKCYLIYFFSPYCPFSAAGTPYVNGLARSLLNIPVYGLDSIEYHSMNARYSVMGTPSLILFHNGLTAARYNASEYSTNNLMTFINYYTTENLTFINVTSNDFKANLPSIPLEASPYMLWLAWTFLIMCGTWLFITSEIFAKITEFVLNNWREAEAQHAHED